MKVSFTGILQHHFWGDYCATVVLRFNSPQLAKDAQQVLGAADPSHLEMEKGEWGYSHRDPNKIHALLSSEQLDKLKSQFKAWGMDQRNLDNIDSMNSSVDHGSPFCGEIEINLPNLNQVSMF